MIDLVNSLNPTQKEAATYLGGPLMIIAGAGSGKTRVITYRIAFLAREVGIPIHHILAVTFTNKAAKEMRSRVCKLMDMHDNPGLPIGTFHARCAMILRRECEAAGLDKNFAILDEGDQRQAIRRVLKEMDISEKRARPAQVQSFINQSKMRLLTPADTAEEFDGDEVPYPEIYKRYQATIERNKSIDFEDLMMKTVVLFQENDDIRRAWAERYQYVMIDEYQDTNHAQFLMSKLLAQDHRNICVVGDEDQSIYSWRGAEISNLLDFETTFPGTRLVKLERNYRSTQTILRAANHVIRHNTQRIGKTLFTEDGEGEQITFLSARNQDEEANRIGRECLRLVEAEGVDANEIAIFYRSHWLSRSLEDQLRRYRLPYRIVGGVRFYDRAEIKDLLSFMRLAVEPGDDLALERVINRPTRGVGDKTLAQLAELASARRISLFDATLEGLNQGLVKGKARTGLEAFTDSIRQWNAMVEQAPATAILDRILFDTNYLKDGIGDATSIEAESRAENIEEFTSAIREFCKQNDTGTMTEFLQSMALDASDERDDNRPKISLLTIHNAKGLEFEYVFTIGMEQGVFPTRRAMDSMEDYALEEERRLFYVAVTRARKKLFLSYSAQRNRPDFFATNEPSQFLREMPHEVFDHTSVQALRKLLPYGWGRDGAAAGRTVVYDEDQSGGPSFSRPASASPFAAHGAASTGPGYSVGDRVSHRYMGEGSIVELGGRKGWERAMIQFDDGRSQEFVLKYAPIKKV